MGGGAGAAFLLTAAVGSGIMAERLSAGNPGLALPANAIATARALFALVTALAPVSGAHLNPAGTLVHARARLRDLRRAPPCPGVRPCTDHRGLRRCGFSAEALFSAAIHMHIEGRHLTHVAKFRDEMAPRPAELARVLRGDPRQMARGRRDRA
ncbi:aquaporin [Albidovulum sp.]|uniref:aquaporin n=1 Tax=Albidovulum sp. TaxID=1872424 RepID=UPI0039B9C1A2